MIATDNKITNKLSLNLFFITEYIAKQHKTMIKKGNPHKYHVAINNRIEIIWLTIPRSDTDIKRFKKSKLTRHIRFMEI